MKSVKRSLIIVILVVAILITSSGVALCVYLKNFYRKSQEIEDYLSNYARNPSIVYSNELGIYFSDRTINVWDIEKLADYDIENMWIYDITKDYVYFSDVFGSKTNVYRSDHSFESIEIVLSHVKTRKSAFSPETGIRYETEDGAKYIYSIEENKSSIDENYEHGSAIGNEYYLREIKREGIQKLLNEYTYIITNKKTGIERKINQSYIDNLEKDEFMMCLSDMGALNFPCVYLNDEDVYIRCNYGSIGTLFEYDFENEKMYFVDWFVADTYSDSDFKIHFIDDVKLDEESKVDN